MKKAIHISIPKPCHEDWVKMNPTKKGRHCASCEKQVTDYTQKTDEQLVKLLSKIKTKKTAPNSFAKTIIGNITDVNGLPLPGVNIIIKGTVNGTQSGFDGNYEINVIKGQTLVYSYVGFEKQEIITIESSERINLKLIEGNILGEVVIKGCVDTSFMKPMVTKPNWYSYTTKRKCYQNTLDFLKLKIERKKEARTEKRAKLKAARLVRKKK